MKDGYMLHARAWLAMVSIPTFLFFAPHSGATTHIITFGGSVGTAYSPSSLAVAVEDTIEWQGNFTFHPLSSTTIPAGAPTWHNGAGTVFDYVVKLPGTYNYECDNHSGLGMVGSFTAATTGVNDRQTIGNPFSFRLEQNFPNPFNPTTEIRYEIAGIKGQGSEIGTAKLVVYNSLGQEVATLVNEMKQPGMYTVRWDASGVASGVYFYQFTAGNFIQTKRLLLMK